MQEDEKYLQTYETLRTFNTARKSPATVVESVLLVVFYSIQLESDV